MSKKIQELENEVVNFNSLKKSKNQKAQDFEDLDYLKNQNAIETFDPNNNLISSPKLDMEREQRVQDGLAILESVEINGVKLSETFLLLAKWWENKPARNSIKSMLNDEAISKGYEPHDYVQNIIGSEIEKLSTIQDAINRVRYVKTYFKPRGEVKSKLNLVQVNFNGIPYEIDVLKLNALKSKYPNKANRKEFEKEFLEIAKPMEMETL